MWGLLSLGAMLMLVGLLLSGVAQRLLNEQQTEGLATG
ncbi:putative membrane protein [Candidatus Erwinia dacicola]|uniref:Membrane protein n=1 Tax=Candidatus Erwinia dacicola TaxID=252393 RepID=A0A328TQI9_9GAMM|nr:putative membrane protein [Candidatus Erwinia dacicola]